MDVIGRVRLSDGTECSVVTGIDDHSRFCVCARLVRRATAQPVCSTFAEAMRTHGVPDAVLADNGKVFTGRFGITKTEVFFDRLCRENGVRHLLIAPYSPTTTGKIERLHKTMRAEFFSTVTFDTIEETQAALDAWVTHYNTERPHQGIGDVVPARRFALAQTDTPVIDEEPPAKERLAPVPASVVPPATRPVGRDGWISLARNRYSVGRWLAGETVEVMTGSSLVEIFHRGVLVISHVARHDAEARIIGRVALNPAARRRRSGAGSASPAVTRLVDRSGDISFAGHGYRAGRDLVGRSVEVAVVERRR